MSRRSSDQPGSRSVSYAEPEESLRLRAVVHDDFWEPQQGPVFTGTVRDVS